MKTFGVIIKIVIALAAVAGLIYVVAAYGDKIVAWARNLLAKRKRKHSMVPTGDFAEETEDIVAGEFDFEG